MSTTLELAGRLRGVALALEALDAAHTAVIEVAVDRHQVHLHRMLASQAAQSAGEYHRLAALLDPTAPATPSGADPTARTWGA